MEVFEGVEIYCKLYIGIVLENLVTAMCNQKARSLELGLDDEENWQMV